MNEQIDTNRSIPVQPYLEAHLQGRTVEVPESLREEFENAITAHRRLCSLLETPPTGAARHFEERLPPNMADRYTIERELGRGGMGVVYLALQRSLDRYVALKVLRPSGRDSASLLQRFRDEAQHLARLRHPNIVSIHEVGDAEGEPYFTMDFIDGEPLSAAIARGPLSPTRAVEIVKQVAAAIQHAHRQGIIHRDLKPANVLIDQHSHVLVTDFGLARNLGTDSNLTQSNELLGTPQYMSPEQARGQTQWVGEATDIHALGLLLYEMLAGRPAFAASSPADGIVKLLNEDPPALRQFDRRIPRDLETICFKALQKRPAARYANVSALLEDVRRFEGGEPLLARRPPPIARLIRWAGRHWRLAVAVLVTAVAVSLAAPRLFDKSFEELMTWGSEELAAGRPEVAAQVFQRALQRSAPAQHDAVLGRLAEAIRGFDDADAAVDQAMSIVRADPTLSFGKHDFLVAQAAMIDARRRMPNQAFEPVHGISLDESTRQACQLAMQRLSLFLDGTWGSQKERNEAQGWLNAIQNSTREQWPVAHGSPFERARLPEGSFAELSRQLDDRSIDLWDRGLAAMALGRDLEARDEPRRALEYYRQALDLLRRRFPIVTGVSADHHVRAQRDTQDIYPDSPECRLLRELLDDLERLDPRFVDPAPGGLILRVEADKLPADLTVGALIELSDVSNEPSAQNRKQSLSRLVGIGLDGERAVSIIDGTYRLRLLGTSKSWSPLETLNPELIEIHAEGWPQVVEIQGGWVELPTLQVRQLEEIALLAPRESARVNLNDAVLSWQEIPAAEVYQVQLAYFVDLPHPQSFWFNSVESSRPQLAIAEIVGQSRAAIQKNWLSGRIAGFRVHALDADGRRLGTSIGERRFLVAGELSESPE